MGFDVAELARTSPVSIPIVRSTAPGLPSGCAVCAVRGLCLPSWTDSDGALQRLQIGHRKIRKGQAVYREGDRFLFMYAVRVGTFKSTAAFKVGRDQVVAFHLPGELFGFDGLADGRHPTTTVAIEDAQVCAVSYAELNQAAALDGAVRQQIFSLISSELVRERKLLSLVAATHAEERVAAFLLNLANRLERRGYSAREFQLRMTREEIGGYLGMTLETVSRTLSAFARKGYVSVLRRRIEILDPQGLRDTFGLGATGDPC